MPTITDPRLSRTNAGGVVKPTGPLTQTQTPQLTTHSPSLALQSGSSPASGSQFTFNDALSIGANIVEPIINNDAAQDSITQINAGFNEASGQIIQGRDTANQSITDARDRGVAAQQPFYDAGLGALAEFEDILQNPDQILNDPGVQFQFDQGEEALRRNLENAGQLGSGRRFLAAQEFGQGLASTSMDAALNRRLPLINAGTGAANSITSLEQATGTNLANVATGSSRDLADIAIDQNVNLSGRDIVDAQRDTGLLDVGLDIAEEILGDVSFEEIAAGAGAIFGGTAAAGTAAAGTAAAGTAAAGTAASAAAGGAVATAVPGFPGPAIPMTALAPEVGATAATGTAAAGTAGTAGAAPAPGFLSTPAGAATIAGPMAGIMALWRGDGTGQAMAQGGGAAAGAAIGMTLSGGNPVGAILGGFIGGFAGGKLGEKLGISMAGGGDDKPDYSIGTGDHLSDRALSSTGEWGTVGFGHHKHLTGNDRYKAALDAVTETDNAIAAGLTAEENKAIKEALQKNMVAKNSNEGGYNPARLMTQVFNHRAQVVEQAIGAERFSELKLGEIYTALASGDPNVMNETFGV